MAKPTLRVPDVTVNALYNRIDYLDSVINSPSAENPNRWQSDVTVREVRKAQRALSKIADKVRANEGRLDAQWFVNWYNNTDAGVLDAAGYSIAALEERAFQLLEG
jgi:hypothetical protein